MQCRKWSLVTLVSLTLRLLLVVSCGPCVSNIATTVGGLLWPLCLQRCDYCWWSLVALVSPTLQLLLVVSCGPCVSNIATTVGGLLWPLCLQHCNYCWWSLVALVSPTLQLLLVALVSLTLQLLLVVSCGPCVSNIATTVGGLLWPLCLQHCNYCWWSLVALVSPTLQLLLVALVSLTLQLLLVVSCGPCVSNIATTVGGLLWPLCLQHCNYCWWSLVALVSLTLQLLLVVSCGPCVSNIATTVGGPCVSNVATTVGGLLWPLCLQHCNYCWWSLVALVSLTLQLLLVVSCGSCVSNIATTVVFTTFTVLSSCQM